MSLKTFAIKKSFLSSSLKSSPELTAAVITGKAIKTALKTGTKSELNTKTASKINETAGTERIKESGKAINALKSGKIPERTPAIIPKKTEIKNPAKTRSEEKSVLCQNSCVAHSSKSLKTVAVNVGKTRGVFARTAKICHKNAKVRIEIKFTVFLFILEKNKNRRQEVFLRLTAEIPAKKQKELIRFAFLPSANPAR